MKKNTNFCFWLLLALVTICCSCRKTETVLRPTSSVTVFNATSDQTVLFPDFYQTGKLSFADIKKGISSTSSGDIKFSFTKGFISGVVPISFYAFPDSVKAVVSVTREYKPGGIYSYFFCGTRSAVDTLFSEDRVPAIAATDSVLLIRFVNLTDKGRTVSVNLLGKTEPLPGLESLNYKDITGFFKFSVKSADFKGDTWTVQVRDPATGQVLATEPYSWYSKSSLGSTNLFLHPLTVVISKSGGLIKVKFIDPFITI